MSENVDCFIVKVEEGLDAADPVSGWPVVAMDVLVESKML